VAEPPWLAVHLNLHLSTVIPVNSTRKTLHFAVHAPMHWDCDALRIIL
jgi:hypothetical protein